MRSGEKREKRKKKKKGNSFYLPEKCSSENFDVSID